MHTNIGTLDCAIRIGIGIALLALFPVLNDSYQWLGMVGVIPLATGLMRWCPAYALSGVNSLHRR